MYKIFPWLFKTLSLQNQPEISEVKKMIMEGSSLQVIRQKVPLQMLKDKELVDLLIKQHLEGAICKTFQAENISAMKKEWDDVDFLLGLLENQRNKFVIEDHTEDSNEVIEVKLDDDVIIEDIAEPKSFIATEDVIEDQPEDSSEAIEEDLDDLIKLIKEHNTEDFDDLIKLIRADQPEVFDEFIRADPTENCREFIGANQLEDSAEVIQENVTEPNSAIATELSRQELLGHYLCTTIALVRKRQYDMESHHIDDEDLINCMHSFQKNIIQILLKNKANPNVKIEGSTPLSWVAGDGDNESMQLLLADPRVDLNSQTTLGNIPLYFAVICNNPNAIKLLLAAPRLDPNIKNNEGDTALHLAWKRANFGSIKLLLADQRVDPNIKNNEGDTVLHLSVRYNDLEIIELLLADPRLDPNIQNHLGNTALHWARLTNNDRAISLLIEQGARLDIKNNLGNTPLHNIINLDLDSEQNGSNKLIKILDALTPKALSNIYCVLRDQRYDQGKKDQLNKYILQRNGLNQDLMPKIVQKQIHVNKFLQNATHKNLFAGKAITTQCEDKIEQENGSLKDIMKKPFFRQGANSFSTLISKIELKDQGSDFNIFKESRPQNELYQSHGDNLVGELDNLLHDAQWMGGAIVPYHPESR